MTRSRGVSLFLLGVALGLLVPFIGGEESAHAESADLQELIDATEAGGTLRLGPGRYRGGVTIEKPITIIGVDWPVVDAGGKGNGLVLRSPDITIRGVVVRNTGSSVDGENAGIVSTASPRAHIEGNKLEDVLFGIYVRSSPDSVVRGNTIGAKDLFIARRGDGIRLWESDRSRVEGNVVARGRDVVLWFSNDLQVKGNRVVEGRYGLHFMYCDDVSIEGNWLEGNSVGGFLMYSRRLTLKDNVLAFNRGPSGYGIGLKDIDGVEATGNRIVGNRIGIYLENSPVTHGVKQHFESNLLAYNDIGIEFAPSVKNNVFTANAFIDNREQVGLTSTGQFRGNEWTVDGVGNYWSDFAGFDADGDDIGDIDYRIENLFSHWTDENPDLLLFSETPAARAVDLASNAFPVMRPNPKVVDEGPLTEVPPLTPMPGEAAGTSARSLVLVSVGLLAAAVLIIASSGALRLRRTVTVRFGEAT